LRQVVTIKTGTSNTRSALPSASLHRTIAGLILAPTLSDANQNHYDRDENVVACELPWLKRWIKNVAEACQHFGNSDSDEIIIIND